MSAADSRPIADWYFDVISPYAYFASLQLSDLSRQLIIRPRPILFAALLNHWGQKGPAEIAVKRVWTYQSCVWFAQRHGLTFAMPASHPFNPLPYLRLATAALGEVQEDKDAIRLVRRLMAELWTTGADAQAPATIARVADKLGVDSARITDVPIKQALRARTDEAVQCGVFGVPSFHVNGQTFWGADATDFMLGYLDNPALFEQPDMQQAARLPHGAVRSGVGRGPR